MIAAADLEDMLQGMMGEHFGGHRTVTVLRQEPYIYSTSFILTDVEVQVAGGSVLRLIVKDLSATGLLHGARASKPEFLYEPRREIQTYQRLLDRADLGTATCYGALVDEAGQRYALVLEKVNGLELYQVGDLSVWIGVAEWLAGMHALPALAVEPARRRNLHLVTYDAAYYRRWLDRARRFRDARGEDWADIGHGLDRALDLLAGSPHSFVHGEFYASNVLVGHGSSGRRVCPVDWEMAGVGPALLDLAALCTGWDDEDVQVITQGYHRTLGASAGWPRDEQELLRLLHAAQLCLAVQWLGWSPGWEAPREHARDWLGDATRLAERVAS